MKRVFRCLLLVMLLITFSGCRAKETVNGTELNIYYVSTQETKVEAHSISVSAFNTEGKIEEALNALGQIPEKLHYKAPLQMGFTMNSYSLSESKLTIDVSEEYLKLTPTVEVLVRAAIVRTLTQINGVKYVTITVDGNRLYDAAGEQVNWMTGEMFIDNDGSEINSYEMIKIKLYFVLEDEDKLASTIREKYYSTNTPVERFVVEELIAGPTGQVEGICSSVNPETKIISVTTKDSICYVNLDGAFLSYTDTVPLELSVYSIVDSLTDLPGVSKVQILINGDLNSNLSENLYERNLDYVND